MTHSESTSQQPRICVPVTGKTIQELIIHAQSVPPEIALIEARVDLCNQFSTEELTLLREHIQRPLILTCRSREEGGSYRGTEDKRIHLLRHALTYGFEYVDIEYQTIQTQQDLLPGTVSLHPQTEIILSYHNFTETPSTTELNKLVHAMQQVAPSIIKIATQVQSIEDQQRLIRLMLTLPQDLRYIIIGMGEQGKLTRVAGPFLGSFLTFASLSKASTAPGQIDLTTLQSIYQVILPTR